MAIRRRLGRAAVMVNVWMPVTKTLLNSLLRRLNVRLESCSADRAESARLNGLVELGHFRRPIVPVLEQFRLCDPTAVFDAVNKYEAELRRFSGAQPGQYSFKNDYYASPDAEVLYAMVRTYRPRRIVEIGSGNSTLLFRQAIVDGGLTTRVLSIDPSPRVEVETCADQVIRERVELLDSPSIFAILRRNDFVFIDSSHEVRPGNDVLHLLLTVLPALAPGVIVHIHDIFLPFEYPEEWVVKHRWAWGEQYILQALLYGSKEFEVLWAGHYLQQSFPTFKKNFPYWSGADARSVWLRKAERVSD